MKKQFTMSIQTKKDVEQGICYCTVAAWGTKKFCLEQMEKLFSITDTVKAIVRREKDGAIIAELTR